MGYSELSIPADIAWKRLGVSADMLDRTYGDVRFPSKWDTSIAAFYHEPVDTDPAYCNRRITYLKIVCTITNYQLSRHDVTVLDEMRDKYGLYRPYKEFELNVTRAYPCHGALLQVGVYPNPDDGVELYDYPYVSSLQPRKRELYEVATQSGEVASQSANKLNVMKGGTTTATTEDYDLDMGGGGGGHSGIFGLWSEQHTGEQKQVGTIQRSQTQNQNVSTTDASRDRREAYSFSTSINQLHTLLQSYHLGTNRVMFFMQPVPHMQDAKFSFLRGLRRIEGVQEFFLIINRPAHVKGFCLEIALETAHLNVRKAYMPRFVPLSDVYSPANLAKTEQAIGSAVKNNTAFDWYRQVRDAWNSLWPTDRWNLSQQGWYPSDATETLAAEIFVRVPQIGIQDAALIFEEYDAHTGSFFVAGRRFCVCWEPKPHEAPSEENALEEGDELAPTEEPCEESSPASLSRCDGGPGSIVFEERLDAITHEHVVVGAAQMYNGMTMALNESLSSSLLSSDRIPYGEGSFFATEFMLAELNELVRRAADTQKRVRDMRAVSGSKTGAGARLRADTTLLEFATMPTSRLTLDLGINAASARRLKMEVLLEALQQADVKSLREFEDEAVDPSETREQREQRWVASARGTAQPQPRAPFPRRPGKRS